MDQNFVAERDLGYTKLVSVDTATLVSTAVVNGVPGIPAGTLFVLVQPETQGIRMRSDGTIPTSTLGYPLAPGAEFKFTAAQIPKLQVISQVAGAAVNLWFLG